MTADPTAQRFGEWLTRELALRGSSGPKLAEALGVHRPTVYRWTSGRFRPEASRCKEIADYLGVEHDLVLGMAGYRTYDLTIEGAVRRQVLELVAEIPETLLIPLIPMLRGLAEAGHQAEAMAELRKRLRDD